MSGIVLEHDLRTKLIADGVSEEIVNALDTAMKNSAVDPNAFAYAIGMYESYATYGAYGVHTNMLYMMNNMSKWKGDEARETKKILKKWKWKYES